MKKRIFNICFISFFIFMTFLVKGCSDDVIDSEKGEGHNNALNDTKILARIAEMGFNIDDVRELDNFYLVEGDIMIPKERNDFITKQASTNNLVSSTNIASISVYIHPSIPNSGVDNWRNEIGQALNDWNSIHGSCVNFTLSSSPSSDIIIKSDTEWLPDETIASAGFPSNNKPYNTILINLDFDSNRNVSSGQKRRNIVHELGHCIGFRHTNWQKPRNQGGDNGYVGPGANLISGTPSDDVNSVMNGGTALHFWAGFSIYDIVAAKKLYSCSSQSNNLSPNSVYLSVNQTGAVFSVSGNGPVTVTLSGASGVYLMDYNGSSGFQTSLSLTAPTSFSVYSPSIGSPTHTGGSATVWLSNSSGIQDMSTVYH